MPGPETLQDTLHVRIEHDLCTGDGLCVDLAPEVFEFDVDGIAYVKNDDGSLITDPATTREVPGFCIRDVIDAAKECPGECIFVSGSDGTPVAGPGAD